MDWVREALYADISKRKKEQRKKWQAKYLAQLGVDINSYNEVSTNPPTEEVTKAVKPDVM